MVHAGGKLEGWCGMWEMRGQGGCWSLVRMRDALISDCSRARKVDPGLGLWGLTGDFQSARTEAPHYNHTHRHTHRHNNPRCQKALMCSIVRGANIDLL